MTTGLPAATGGVEALRALLRSLCDEHGVDVELRARLVLSATLLARGHLTAEPATARAEVRTDQDGAATLVVTVPLRAPLDRTRPLNLPLLPEPVDGPAAVWHVPCGGQSRDDGAADDGAADDRAADDDLRATELELRASLGRTEELERERRQLQEELAETNTGVLAMYVELEQRDEQLRRAHAVIFRELEDALRPPPPVVAGVELAVHYKPADRDAPTGGDLYDWFVLPDGSLQIIVVDAVGHGVTCTRNALNVTHTIRTLTREGHAFEHLVRRAAEIDEGPMATVLLARLDPRTGELRLAGGGHPPALLVPAAGEPVYLHAPGRGVGFPSPGSTEVRTALMRPGDQLLLYTDGLVESRGDVDEGEERLVSAAGKHAKDPLDTALSAIVREMHDVVVYTDDTVLLGLRFGSA
ncbi:Serine phosphatase RsbU, regulator of sigma subunit [Lentzea fradiae]|uniref:Serine phosphatase RsbU, regulator of sigma subunit n=1 Tax=Lentzea fradiae TaxID=200378 RepID=A0A1G7KM39_9PSEU|nr:PP2C family protein-serine/threonine phosphatase [Lentzea fradiae]SDF38328.1 Serine phosphatase RsbU, regulator of sigma subunit [Lentzea fradiae]